MLVTDRDKMGEEKVGGRGYRRKNGGRKRKTINGDRSMVEETRGFRLVERCSQNGVPFHRKTTSMNLLTQRS